VKNDFMGKVIIPLGSFENKKAVRKWYKLKNSNGDADSKPRGEIELVIWWHFSLDLKLNPKKEGLLSGVKKGIGGIGRVFGSDDEDEEDDDGEEPAEPPAMDEAAAEAAQKEKEEQEAALKKELGDIEVKSGDYQIQVQW
jgi:hypothetical protein